MNGFIRDASGLSPFSVRLYSYWWLHWFSYGGLGAPSDATIATRA